MGVATKREMGGTDEIQVGIRLPADLHQRLKMEAVKRRLPMKEVFREALEGWLAPKEDGEDEEFQRQMAIARAGMAKYRDALRELAR